MKNLLKKLLLVSCVSAMLVTPTSIFANELPKQETLEAVGIPENGVMPVYTDKNQVVIPNGETYYFVNKDTKQPFLFRKDSVIKIVLGYYSPGLYDFGVLDGNNNVISLHEFSNGAEDKYIFHFMTFTAPQTDKYTFFVTNYSPDPLTIDQFNLNLVYPSN